MNTYLLLRDNKQSGPYSVPDIIAKGIKPYDLVWLEGKSAAWRYPSEIEELKAYSPAVEEQPFDRFFKKAETQPDNKPQTEQQSSFAPVVARETVRNLEITPRKVYINFPGGQNKLPVYPEPVTKEKPVAFPNNSEPVMVSGGPVLARNLPAADSKLRYAAIVACLVLLAIISVLVINYNSQRNNIHQLNTLVQRLEKMQADQTQSSKASLASHPLPVPAPAVSNEEPLTVVPISMEPTANSNTKKIVKTVSPEALPASVSTGPIIKEQPLHTVAPQKILPPASPENLYQLVSVQPNTYKTGVLGGISNLQFTLSNRTGRQLQKVAVEIKYLSPEKKVVKIQTVYFENIAPGSGPVINVPKSNRGVSIEYAITDIMG